MSVAESGHPAPRRPARKRDVITGSRPWRFLVEQVEGPVTTGQIVWDVVFGGLMPPFMVWLDRYWDPMGDDGVIPLGRVYVMLLTLLGALSIALFHALRTRSPRLAAAAAAPLWATGSVALGLGTVLLPLSLIGVFLNGMGLLGLTPFVAAFVHYRCARRALRPAEEAMGRAAARWMTVALAMVGLGVAAVGGKGAKVVALRDQHVLLGERAGDRDAALARLRVLWHVPGVSLWVMQDAYYAALFAAEASADLPSGRMAEIEAMADEIVGEGEWFFE